MIIEKPPAFGSSVMRFAKNSHSTTDMPGPGDYNVGAKKRKKPKKIVKYINPSMLSPVEKNLNRGSTTQSARSRDRNTSELDKFFLDRPKGYRT